MKQAVIFKTVGWGTLADPYYYFKLYVSGNFISASGQHETKLAAIAAIKRYHTGFEIIDKTGEK